MLVLAHGKKLLSTTERDGAIHATPVAANVHLHDEPEA